MKNVPIDLILETILANYLKIRSSDRFFLKIPGFLEDL